MNIHLKPGDWLVLGAAISLVATLALHAWMQPKGDLAVVMAGGKVFAELNLARDGMLDVPGPLGMTQVEISHHRIRVARDPGPRQICVRQGWFSRAGQSVLCLPNQVSVEITGATRLYDSMNY